MECLLVAIYTDKSILQVLLLFLTPDPYDTDLDSSSREVTYIQSLQTLVKLLPGLRAKSALLEINLRLCDLPLVNPARTKLLDWVLRVLSPVKDMKCLVLSGLFEDETFNRFLYTVQKELGCLIMDAKYVLDFSKARN